ncbi:MAG: hypothetical protein NC206_08535 [Bacteroides sp.]|nr:hypothetical protein [Roseburia sp.]MCM1347116.1 hypothetical protein [Bacteroides sp.]MCM1421662.1 hypothetical protein [Bacteroides sp.]
MKISTVLFMLSCLLSMNMEAHHADLSCTDSLEDRTSQLRDLLNAANADSSDFGTSDYSGFVDSVQNVYRRFRMDCNKRYAEFVRQAWKQYGAEPPVRKPRMEKMRVVPVADTTKRVTTAAYKVAKVVRKPSRQAQPAPFFKIPEEKPFLVDEKPEARTDVDVNMNSISALDIVVPENDKKGGVGYEWMDFYFYGTKCKVRLGNANKFVLKDCRANTIADTWLMLSEARFSNVIKDCLELRSAGRLCDWAYLQMLKALSETFCGEGTNEAAMLTAYIYCQSGYKMRLATVDDKLYMLYGTKDRLYNNYQYYIINDAFFYPLQKCESSYMDICDVAYPKEQELSLLVWTEQRFNMKATDTRSITSYRYPELAVEVKENKNLIDFYNSYPAPEGDNNFMTRWVMYANTPMGSHARAAIYPTLHKQLEGCTQLEAVNKLLNFVQTGFVYRLDEEVWGEDRAFFADETLFYPYSDCEDRSILFSRLVRDLLGMKVALVYYPGHLATAVRFDKTVEGDCIVVDNEKYTICDPTYTHACVGLTMPQMDNNQATAILLE